VANGSLSLEPRGTNGFGWDAIFIPEGYTRTFGEMTAAEKDARSHRRKAWELLRERLVDL
jgi:XTP/dITP diphosphohydrolase